MKSLDDLFRTAVTAIDAGDVDQLERLITEHPQIVCDRLESPGAWLREKVGGALDGFFQKPYLLWFVAEDPVRTGRLPVNIADAARTITNAAKRLCPNAQEQLDYALRLVAWSWIARESGVQIALIDVLIDAGASMNGTPGDALVNGNVAAAEHLVERGAPLSLATAACLGRWDDVDRLAATASSAEKQLALTLTALRGRAEAIQRLIPIGVDVNAVSAELYSHATPLHHAVYSGSLEAVKVLVEAGARLDIRDTAYDGTPLGWAEYSSGKPAYAEIAKYLKGRGAP